MTHPVRKLDRWWRSLVDHRRIDSSLGNMFMLIGLMFPALSIVLNGPVPTSVLAEMPNGMQVLMCACIFLGCGMKLHGALAGRRFWFPNTPLARCYRYGVTGAFPASMGTWVYAGYILPNTENFSSAMGAVSTPMFGMGVALQAFLYWLEARRIEQNQVLLMEQRQIAEREKGL